MNKKETGKIYEERAALYLEGKGVIILERNFRCRQGEVDLIGIHDGCLVFVEVKYRKNLVSGTPEEAVSTAKQLKICLVSDYYRLLHPVEGRRQVRYDVLAVSGEKATWYQNAFPYSNKRGGTFW